MVARRVGCVLLGIVVWFECVIVCIVSVVTRI